MSTGYSQFRALLFEGGSLAASVAWAFMNLPGRAGALLILGALGIYGATRLITLIPFVAVTVVGLIAQSPERVENAKEFFHLFLRLFGR